MKGLVVFYNVVASVISFNCLQRRSKHICRYSGCCLYSVVHILASALTMDDVSTLFQNFIYCGEELLKIHRILPKLMAIFRRRILEIGVMLFVNSCTTLLPQTKPI